jgi:cytochrome c5
MRILASTILIAVAGLLLPAGAARAADDVDAATKAKIAQFDRGQASIDVSAYPAGIQKNYAIFKQKCTLCHTLARPINCDFALPDEWSRYVKRMMHKPGSMINQANAKKIYEFLVFDSSIRKKALLDAKLAAVPADRSAAEARIREVVQAYGRD